MKLSRRNQRSAHTPRTSSGLEVSPPRINPEHVVHEPWVARADGLGRRRVRREAKKGGQLFMLLLYCHDIACLAWASVRVRCDSAEQNCGASSLAGCAAGRGGMSEKAQGCVRGVVCKVICRMKFLRALPVWAEAGPQEGRKGAMSSITIATRLAPTPHKPVVGTQPPVRWRNKTGISQNALEILALLWLVARNPMQVACTLPT